MSNGNKNDDWLKGMKSLLIIASIISLGLIGFYAFYTRGIISSKQSDWAAFGSFLSGVFSFFGAIGTVGVMILAIKQFKVQQEQINAQNTRQDAFEAKQQEKWDKENEMLNFQKYQMHKLEFMDLLKNLEMEYQNINFYQKNQTYNNIFNNSFSETSLKISPTQDGLIKDVSELFNSMHIEILELNQSLKQFKNEGFTQEQVDLIDSCSTNIFNAAFKIIKKIGFSFNSNRKPFHGDICSSFGYEGINIFRISDSIESIYTIFTDLAAYSLDFNTHRYNDTMILIKRNSLELCAASTQRTFEDQYIYSETPSLITLKSLLLKTSSFLRKREIRNHIELYNAVSNVVHEAVNPKSSSFEQAFYRFNVVVEKCKNEIPINEYKSIHDSISEFKKVHFNI